MAQQVGSAGSFFRKPAPPAAPPPPTFRPPLPPSGLGIPDAVPPPLPAARRRLSFHGTGGTLFGIHVVNVLFTVLTLGVYYFWGKTRIRRYLFGESAFEGDRYAYPGTAPELLLGFVKAVVVFFLPEERLRSVSGIEARRQEEADELSAAAVSAEAAGLSTASSQMVDGETISHEGQVVAVPPRG